MLGPLCLLTVPFPFSVLQCLLVYILILDYVCENHYVHLPHLALSETIYERIFSVLKFVYTQPRKQNLTPSGTSIVRDSSISQQTNKHPLRLDDNGRKHPDVVASLSIVIFLVIARQW